MKMIAVLSTLLVALFSGRAAAGCDVVIEVTNTGPHPVTVLPRRPETGVAEEGNTFHPFVSHMANARLEPGETVEVIHRSQRACEDPRRYRIAYRCEAGRMPGAIMSSLSKGKDRPVGRFPVPASRCR